MPIGIDDIELRSENVQQILKKPPPGLVRWGSSVSIFVIIIMLTVSSVIRRPQIISTPIILSVDSLYCHDHSALNFFGELRVSQLQVNRLATRQPVKIRLDLFPHEKFGVLNGYISKISKQINRDNSVSVYVCVNSQANDENAKISLTNGLIGNAEIITGNKTLLKIFLGQ